MAANLRRRGGQSTLDVTRPEAEPIPQSIPGADDKQPQLKHPEDESYAEVVGTKPKTRKRRNAFIFSLGGLFGIVLAGFFASTNDLIEFPEFSDLSFESVLQMLPEGMINDYRDLLEGERTQQKSYEAFSAGLQAFSEGFTAHHPMIMIPGVISTGLESWGTANFSRSYFRKRLWGSWTMMGALVMDKEVWKRHLMLDPMTGLDPPEIKLRAAQGFDATDFFITGYWIWNKIFENLASIGYDPTNAFTAAYDWRLSYPNLEVRDKYFTRIKSYLETSMELSGTKAVLVSHSMGSQVLFYFFHWVASEHGGRGGDDWVEKHIDSWINVSGCMLGAAKDLPAVLSGEMRDTAQLNALAVYGLEKFLSREERAELFRAMPGLSSMLPIGGDAVWGDMNGAPDDLPGQNFTFGSFLNFRAETNAVATHQHRNLTLSQSMDYLLLTAEPWYRDMVKRSYSQGIAHTKAEVEANEKDPRKWINPLETRLPLAPNLKIYCFYGVGKPTERAYYYRTPESALTRLNVTIDTGLTADAVDHGVIMGEGDGTVNLLSTGYMCNRGWTIDRYNPAGSKITVVEMPHEPERFSPRGGPRTADHVDILGRQNLNELILKVAAGRGDLIENHVVSNIMDYADKVKVYEE